MLQRKGVPRSHSNASYFHSSLLPLTDNRKTAPASARRGNNNGVGNGTSGSVDGGFASISLSTVGRAAALFAISIVTITILRVAVSGSSITEELELDVAEGAVALSAVGGGLRNNNYWQTMDEQKLPLSDYPSIQYALENSDIVLLYFAASWCPMSTPITKLLDEKFGDILLHPEGTDDESTRSINNQRRRPISLVYVSSDESEVKMKAYSRKNWIDVPFQSEERTTLKKHFKVAAKREMEVLNMPSRLYEIPAIIVVSGESHNVLTTHGVDDLREKGSEALIHWIKLLHTIKALEDKY
ncbi:nucleoredoxin-like [Seminavis robusta]|uniref:Nucleoredoxin-like n=1 Tax=Seminavis robusta TaxID=568900 RepID=A0A9N8EB46_9STRA|nr:nucleoredoxin-like [Seminavis robusta]|eukprot:Sro867_g213160.1 nucleoredoxin-like (299) ;mRNA; f:11052-11948